MTASEIKQQYRDQYAGACMTIKSLERELAAVTAERDALRQIVAASLAALDSLYDSTALRALDAAKAKEVGQ